MFQCLFELDAFARLLRSFSAVYQLLGFLLNDSFYRDLDTNVSLCCLAEFSTSSEVRCYGSLSSEPKIWEGVEIFCHTSLTVLNIFHA